MRTKSSCCVVINEKDEILLVLREDFRIWTLPGGGLEPNETWEQAAVRETREETGYKVAIERYVGEYWRPQLSGGEGDLRHVFIAKVTTEVQSRHDDESIEVRWFSMTSLPKRMNRFVMEHIHDALALATPVSKEQRLPPWMAILARTAVSIRNIRNKILPKSTSRQGAKR